MPGSAVEAAERVRHWQGTGNALWKVEICTWRGIDFAQPALPCFVPRFVHFKIFQT